MAVALLRCRYLQKHAVSTVYTFDAHGVSGHPNHVATYHGVRYTPR